MLTMRPCVWEFHPLQTTGDLSEHFYYISEQPCVDLYRLFWLIIEMIEDYCIITFVINPPINPNSSEYLSTEVFLFNLPSI